MTALLTDNLPLLAGAPNGIKKLRGLILELAVRGKLVPQDPSDEPASELLKRITEEKARLAAVGALKKQKPLQGMTDEEQPFQISSGWEWCKLAELMPDFQNGASSRGDSSGITVTVLRLADIKSGEISLENTRSLTLLAATVSNYSLVADDILLIRVNGSADLVGRFVVCRSELHAIPCDHFIRMRFPKDIIDSAYLKIVGDSELVRRAIAGLFVSTAGQKTVNQGHIGSLPIPLPPLAAQHRIVAKVDELMALCDRLEAQQADAESAHAQLVQALLDSLTQASDATDFAANWQRLAEHFHTLFTTEPSIDTLKQTLLQLAVMGKLVPQDPSDQPASELLKRIAEEKARLVTEGKIKKQKPLTEISDEEKPFELPAGWMWTRLEEISHVFSGNAFKSEDFQEESGTKVIKITNAGVGEFIKTNDYLPAGYEHEHASFRVLKGDLILALTRPYISTGLKISRCPTEYDGALLNQRVAAIRISNATNNEFGFLFFKSPIVLAIYQERFGNSGLQPNLKMADVTSLVIPIPPAEEQHRIVAKVDQLMALCDQLKTRLTQARQLNEQLASTLVEQAVA